MQTPKHLRLFEESTASSGVAIASPPRLELLNRAFALATGWQLDDAVAARAEALTASPGATVAGQSRLPLEQASALAEALAGLAADLERAEHALCQREAELAAAVPVVRPRDAASDFAQRLEAILKAGAEGIGCTAAGLYLLDDATTSLTLRARWNLPVERFAAGSRPLAAATADLEALCGHAVAVEESADDSGWNPPERFPAMICVPVASAHLPLGTLWLFADRPRQFSDADLNVAELLAGRLAAELERQSVIAGHTADVLAARRLAEAAHVQQNQLPRVAPLIENWSVAGWTHQGDEPGGSFHDWMTTADDRLLLAAAQALDGGIAAALVAAGLRAAWRAYGQHRPTPARLLERVNHSLWTGSAGDQHASLASVLIDPARGRLLLATAGSCLAMLINDDGCEQLAEGSLALGRQPTVAYPAIERTMEPGDVLVVACGTKLDIAALTARAAAEQLRKQVRLARRQPIADLLEIAREFLLSAGAAAGELSVVVAQHHQPRRAAR